MRPSKEEALGLHRKHGSNEIIVKHCVEVARVAQALASRAVENGRDVDVEVVVAGALLHDIGRNRTQTVRHGLEGSVILLEEGVDERVVEVVRRHVGAGISAEEASSLGLPDYDYIPQQIEEVIVCFADKMVDLDSVRPFEAEVMRFEKKGHDVARLKALRARVAEELGVDPEDLLLDKIKESQ